MKKTLLSIASALVAVSGFSQSPTNLSKAQRDFYLPVPAVVSEGQMLGDANSQTPTTGQGSVNRTVTETQIGETIYDLQTNSSIQRRIIRNSNETTIATWTFSPGPASSGTTWPIRGTGYNYFNGTSWGTAPSATIESAASSTERTGWPNPLRTGYGKEVIIAHSTANSIFHKMSRISTGTGTWSQANMTNQHGQVWGRSAIGGANANTLHMIGMTLPVANDGSLYSCSCPSNGMDGAFLYNRSTNGGTTFDIVNHTIPGTGALYFDGFDGDSYAIDTKGDTVAIVVGGLGRGVQLFKSTNNGVSWTKTNVLISDVAYTTSTIVDTTGGYRLYSSDGSVNVLIDNDGVCHVWFGGMNIANPDGSGTIFYPYTNAMEYWNENYPAGFHQRIFGFLDLNNNGQIDMNNPGGQYRLAGLVSHPQAGIDEEGCIYLSYTMVREDLVGGTNNYRHTYVTKTCDGGCSWSFPIDVTQSGNSYTECVFPSIARRVDDDIHILYMADNEPGVSVGESPDHDPVVNKMRYLTEDADRFDTVAFCPTSIEGDTFLCLGGFTTLAALGGDCGTYSWTGPSGFSSTSQVIQAQSFGTYTCTIVTPCGSQTESVNVSAYNGPSPLVTIDGSSLEMCTGGSETLTANSNVSGVSYLWSTNAGSATTQTVTITGPGTYTVTVQDCNGGSTVESITVTQPSQTPTAFISGDLTLCPGGTNTLTAMPAPSASYLWMPGNATTSSIDVTVAGTYTLSITNCIGSSTTSVSVIAEPVPNADIVGEAYEACEGEVLTVSVSETSGGTSFVWSTGSTEATLSIATVGESGTYTVTVSNDCGDTDEASVTLTIHPNPTAPTLSFDGSNYTSSQTGTHMWYVNSVLVEGQTANTFAGNLLAEGDSLRCVYIDENGCISAASNSVVGIEGISDLSRSIIIYPNPNNGQFDIRFGQVNGNVQLSLINTLGQVVYSTRVQAQPNNVESVSLSAKSGVYQLRLESEDGTAVKSLVIE
ncbi:MAG: T9SS type A sorting domain-containing protein [Flavobacteriales bacterium]